MPLIVTPFRKNLCNLLVLFLNTKGWPQSQGNELNSVFMHIYMLQRYKTGLSFLFPFFGLIINLRRCKGELQTSRRLSTCCKFSLRSNGKWHVSLAENPNRNFQLR